MKTKHAVYWELVRHQDTAGIDTTRGEPEPDDLYNIPLFTIECPHEFDGTIQAPDAFGSFRYFRKLARL